MAEVTERERVPARVLIGERLLVRLDRKYRRTYRDDGVIEVRILEVSPSGQWVRVMNEYGNKYWVDTPAIALIEVLKKLEPRPKEVAAPLAACSGCGCFHGLPHSPGCPTFTEGGP